MIIYTAIKEFVIKPENILVSIGDTLNKFENAVMVSVGGQNLTERTFYMWVGMPESLDYLSESSILPDPPVPGDGNTAGGTETLAAGLESLTVTGKGWSFTPSSVVAIVCKPANGSNIIASIISGSISSNGFTAEFSAPIPDSSYTLLYIASA